MLAPSALIKGVVSRLLPSAFIDDRDNDKPIRLKRYGEIAIDYVTPTRHGLVEEGSYILATSPTISTGQTQVAAQTTFVDTTPSFYIYNPENPANTSAKTIWLDYIKMIASAAGATATLWNYALILDTVPRTLATDNTQALTLANPNGNVSPIITPIVKWQNSATASVIAASSAAKRIVGRGALGGLNIVGDELYIMFGTTDVGAHPGLTAVEVAAPSRRVSSEPAIGIGPGQSLTGHIWGIGSTGSFNPEVSIGLFAR